MLCSYNPEPETVVTLWHLVDWELHVIWSLYSSLLTSLGLRLLQVWAPFPFPVCCVSKISSLPLNAPLPHFLHKDIEWLYWGEIPQAYWQSRPLTDKTILPTPFFFFPSLNYFYKLLAPFGSIWINLSLFKSIHRHSWWTFLYFFNNPPTKLGHCVL